MKEDADLMEQFLRISELIARYQHRCRRERGPGGDHRRGQGRIMALLKLRPETTQKELSYLLDIRPQSLGELLAKLERQGFIERNQSEVDRRVANVALTEEGVKAVENLDTSDRFFTGFNTDEQSALSSYLARVIDELEQYLSTEPGGMEEDGHRPHHHGRCHEGQPDRRHGCEGRGPHGTHGPHGHHPSPASHEVECGCGGRERHRPHGMRDNRHHEPMHDRDSDA